MYLSMVEGIVFYVLYKSRVLLISRKAEDFCLFIGRTDEIKKNCYPNLKLIFHCVVGKQQTWSVISKKLHSVLENC